MTQTVGSGGDRSRTRQRVPAISPGKGVCYGVVRCVMASTGPAETKLDVGLVISGRENKPKAPITVGRLATLSRLPSTPGEYKYI